MSHISTAEVVVIVRDEDETTTYFILKSGHLDPTMAYMLIDDQPDGGTCKVTYCSIKQIQKVFDLDDTTIRWIKSTTDKI